MQYKNLGWYKNHPEIIVRHHNERWSELHIHILVLLYNEKESLKEMTHLLGRTENGILGQLHRQKLIWFDKYTMNYYKRGKTALRYNGKDYR